MGLIEWAKRKSFEKEQQNILQILGWLLEPIRRLDAQIDATGMPVTSGPAFEHLMHLRKELYDQIVLGPMPPAAVRAFLEPHLARGPKSLGLAVRATIDQAEKDGKW